MSLGIPVGIGVVLGGVGDDGPEGLFDVVLEGVWDAELDEVFAGGCGISGGSCLFVSLSR
jgi:hypothetical protein